jgi:hypothetical protein
MRSRRRPAFKLARPSRFAVRARSERARSWVRTEAIVLPPRGANDTDPAHASRVWLDGNGEMTGTNWGEESGLLEGAVAVTHAHSEGTVRNAMIAEGLKHGTRKQPCSLPVVAGTWEGLPNDINGFHVKPDDVFAGSRFGQGRDAGRGQYQQRRQLTIAGVPVGKNLPPGESFAEDQRYPPPLRVRRSPGSRPGA